MYWPWPTGMGTDIPPLSGVNKYVRREVVGSGSGVGDDNHGTQTALTWYDLCLA